MAELLYDFPIQSAVSRVFQAVSTPEGLDAWWTLKSTGRPVPGTEFQLWFGPEYDWRAQVSRCEPNTEFEFLITRSMPDWDQTRVGFHLVEQGGATQVHFHHRGWKQATDHFRVTAFCWAMYLRLLRRYLEHGEIVPYGRRLDD